MQTGIKNRIKDAVLLWNNDRRESAFLLTVVSVAAVSRLRYPLEKDGDAFRKTFQDFTRVSLKVEFRGQLEPIENIFYKWIRCELIHEANVPFDIEFVDDKDYGKMSIRAGGHPEYKLKLGTGWFFHLNDSIVNAPELANGTTDNKKVRTTGQADNKRR